MELAGCYTALVTPFRQGQVDYAALKDLIEFQVAAGVDGLVPVGTTGESPTLDFDEHRKVIEFVVEAVHRRCTVVAGSGANSTAEAIDLTRYAATVGADATLQVTPYYNKPTAEGLYRHFSAVADECGLPVVLYNVPGRTGREIPVNVIARLAANPRVIAVKEAGGSVERVSSILSECSVTVLSGDDLLTLPMMAVGARGVISVASNVIPADVSAMVRAALGGRWDEARREHQRLFPFFRDLFVETNPIPVKAALAMLGRIAEEYRLPLCEMSPASRQVLVASMRRAGIPLVGREAATSA
jgi:4-hydroxy-tetrahydrodipicolinate synthase